MKKTIIALSIMPVLAFAITDEQKEAFMQANIKELEKQGLPTPRSGITLVPENSIKMPKEYKQKYLSATKELNAKGYINKNSLRAYEIINIQAEIKKARHMEAKMHKITETHMRHKIEEIAFAYTYVGVPKEEMVEFYGIAPGGTYIKEPQSGWTGAIEFFKSSFANCAFDEDNIFAAHGAAQVAQELATYDVNNKITLVDVEGNPNTGYLYRVKWFDNNFIRSLECATMNYSTETKKATIELAKKIDNAQQ